MQMANPPNKMQFAVFRLPKGSKTHAKRPSFATQKTAFYNSTDYQALTHTKTVALQSLSEHVAVEPMRSFLM